MHAAAVAEARQKELAYMSSENEAQSERAAEMANQEDAANDMQYQQDKSAVDEKLQAYLLQEKDLLHKIAAAEKVAVPPVNGVSYPRLFKNPSGRFAGFRTFAGNVLTSSGRCYIFQKRSSDFSKCLTIPSDF